MKKEKNSILHTQNSKCIVTDLNIKEKTIKLTESRGEKVFVTLEQVFVDWIQISLKLKPLP